jgi:hypothetical protein
MKRVAIFMAGAAALVAVLPSAVASAATVVVTDNARTAGVYDGQVRPTWSACELPNGLLYVGYHQKSSRLYQPRGDGTYANVTPAGAWPLVAGSVAPDRHGCAWADFNLDGIQDMANSTGRNQSNFVKPTNRDNELWLGQPNGTYLERGTESGIADPCTRGRHMATADWTNAAGLPIPDGLPDLFIGAATGRNVNDPCDSMVGSEQPHLFANQGLNPATGQWLGFKLVQALGNDDPGQRCAEAADFTGDSKPDLLGCRLKGETPELWVGGGTKPLTLRTSSASGLTSAVADATPYDVDGDGDLDIVQVRKTSCGYQLNDGTGRFGTYRSVMTLSSEGRSVAIGDTGAGLTMYCMTQNGAVSNPTDYVAVQSGTTWTRYAVPNTTGIADEVYAIHPFGPTGQVEFLVLNGGDGGEAGVGGPVQLISVGTS